MSKSKEEEKPTVCSVTDPEEVRQIMKPGNVKMTPERWEKIVTMVAESGAIHKVAGTDEQLQEFERKTEGDFVRIS